MDEIILINNLVWCSKQIDPILKDFYPHFIIIPQVSSKNSNEIFLSLLPKPNNPNFTTTLEIEDQVQLTYHIMQNKLDNSHIVGRYTLFLNFEGKKKSLEEHISKKKKLKAIYKEFSILILIAEDASIIESEALVLVQDFDLKLERTLLLHHKDIPIAKFQSLSIQSPFIKSHLNDLVLHSLKFRLNSIYQKLYELSIQFYRFEREYKNLQKLLNNEQARQADMLQIVIRISQNITHSLNGEYADLGCTYQGNSSLRGMLSTLFTDHFNQMKQGYVEVIETLTYQKLRIALHNNDTITLQGFLTKNQFCYAFNDIIEYLHQTTTDVINTAYELILQSILKAFKVGLAKYQSGHIICKNIKDLLCDLKTRCFSLIEDVVGTQISEIYFSEECYPQCQDGLIQEVKRIGTKYYRQVIQEVEATMMKLFVAKFIAPLQQQLYRCAMDVMNSISSDLRDEYVLEVCESYENVLLIHNLRRMFDSNSICKLYQQEPSAQETIVVEKAQILTFTQRLKNFFKRQKKQPKQTTSRRQVKFRSKSPDSAVRYATEQISKAQMASEMMLSELTGKNMTVVEWLRVAGDDQLLIAIPYQKLKVSLAHGIPSGIRSTVWAQMTRIALAKLPSIKNQEGYQKLRDQYVSLRSTQSPIYNQIVADVKRTMQRLPSPIYQDMLQNILLAYSNWDRVVGYTQGMNFIVVILILVYSGHLKNQELTIDHLQIKSIEIERNAFLTLVMIMQCKGWDQVLGPHMKGLVVLLNKFETIFRSQFPLLAQSLDEVGFRYQQRFYNLSPQMIVTHHIISIMTSESPYLLSIRILDLFLLVGEEVILETLIFMFQVSQYDILRMNSPDQQMMFIRNQMCGVVFNKCQDELDKIYI